MWSGSGNGEGGIRAIGAKKTAARQVTSALQDIALEVKYRGQIWEIFSVISGALSCALDRESLGSHQPCDEAGVNRGSRFGVIFANRAIAGVRHEEGVAQHREANGAAQPCDEPVV